MAIENDANEAELSPRVKARLRETFAQISQLQTNATQYYKGVIDGMGLDGQWTLDAERMMAVKQSVDETKEE